MLVLSRKRSQTIVIGSGPDAVEVMVLEIRGDKVRLGVTAPRAVPVYREELAPWNGAEPAAQEARP